MEPIASMTPDELLTTTRAVRKRLNLKRPVPMELVQECVEIATQAPSGSNVQNWHFLIVIDPEKRRKIAAIYREIYSLYKEGAAKDVESILAANPAEAHMLQRVNGSADYLAEHLHEVPVHVIPCLEGGSNPYSPMRLDGAPTYVQAASWGSILPAAWSFMLAAHMYGLGTSWTTLHLLQEEKVARILDIPYNTVTQAALIPLAYAKGGIFKRGARKPVNKVIHFDAWNKSW